MTCDDLLEPDATKIAELIQHEVTMWWHYLIAYAFSVVVGDQLVAHLSNSLWRDLGWTGKADAVRPYPHHARMVGIVERALYTASWHVSRPEFIAVWLALKVAGQWRRWSGDYSYDGKNVYGRAFFSVFLIGNAFSIAYGVFGGVLVGWLASGAFLLALIVAAILIGATLLFALWAKRARRHAGSAT